MANHRNLMIQTHYPNLDICITITTSFKYMNNINMTQHGSLFININTSDIHTN